MARIRSPDRGKDGKLTQANIHSLNGNPCRLRFGAVTREVKLAKGKSFQWTGKGE